MCLIKQIPIFVFSPLSRVPLSHGIRAVRRNIFLGFALRCCALPPRPGVVLPCSVVALPGHRPAAVVLTSCCRPAVALPGGRPARSQPCCRPAVALPSRRPAAIALLPLLCCRALLLSARRSPCCHLPAVVALPGPRPAIKCRRAPLPCHCGSALPLLTCPAASTHSP